MGKLFEAFPLLESRMLVIRKMTEDDVDALSEITNNDLVYRYIPPFLYKKSSGNRLTAIRNLGGRDFDKKKMIIAGMYLRAEPHRPERLPVLVHHLTVLKPAPECLRLRLLLRFFLYAEFILVFFGNALDIFTSL